MQSAIESLTEYVRRFGPVPTVRVSSARSSAPYPYWGAVRYEVRIGREGRLVNVATERATSDRRSESGAERDADAIAEKEGRHWLSKIGMIDEGIAARLTHDVGVDYRVPSPSDPLYETRLGRRALPFGIAPTAMVARFLARHERFAGWNRADHRRAAETHRFAMEAAGRIHAEVCRSAFIRAFGREPVGFESYQVSGIGRYDFDDASKEVARAVAHFRTVASSASHGHGRAARARRFTLAPRDAATITF